MCVRFGLSLENASLPSGFQQLPLGLCVNQDLENASLACALQQLPVGLRLNQSLESASLSSLSRGFQQLNLDQIQENASLPSDLLQKTIRLARARVAKQDGATQELKQRLQKVSGSTVSPPCGPQQFSHRLNQTLENVSLPSGLRWLPLCLRFNQSLENASLPSGLQQLPWAHRFNQDLENASLPSVLQQLPFGLRFNQSLENVSLPSGFLPLKFGDFGSNLHQCLCPLSV